MSATDILKSILHLGTLINDAIAGSRGTKFDLNKFLQSDAYKEIAGEVGDIIQKLNKADFSAAVGELSAKQTALLNGRKLVELSNEELIQYARLADAKVILTTQQVKATLDQGFLGWLLDSVPKIITLLPSIALILL